MSSTEIAGCGFTGLPKKSIFRLQPFYVWQPKHFNPFNLTEYLAVIATIHKSNTDIAI